MRILITGSQGFIGQHLTRELQARGHDVWGCDLFHHPTEQQHYARCDIAEYRQLKALFWQEYDYVYHLAAEFGRHSGESSYETMWRTNVIGTRHLLELQQHVGFRLIHFSTSEIYGDWPVTMREDIPTLHPIRQLNDYAISKWANECQIRNHLATTSAEAVIVRLFNVYGPGEMPSPYRSALVRFVYAALTRQDIVVYSGHRRSWLYVGDLIRTLANIPERFKSGEAYNLGSEEILEIEALAQMACEVIGCDQSIIRVMRTHEPMTTRQKLVDSSKAIADLGHEIRTPLDEGIRRTANWLQDTYLKEHAHARADACMS